MAHRRLTLRAISPAVARGFAEVGAVTTQLWNDDPPEAWQAAQRLTAEGMERHDVLHALGDVVTQHLIECPSTQQELAANESYRRDLDSLACQPTPHPRNSTDQ